MNEQAENDRGSELELFLVRELLAHLEGVAIGAPLHIAPSDDLWFSLERFVPQLLSERYAEWRSESIDGFFASIATKTGSRSARLGGICILISDQSVTPFLLDLSASSGRDSISSAQVRLGVAGGGRLGISGPVCDSKKATEMLLTLPSRLDEIEWSYSAARG